MEMRLIQNPPMQYFKKILFMKLHWRSVSMSNLNKPPAESEFFAENFQLLFQF